MASAPRSRADSAMRAATSRYEAGTEEPVARMPATRSCTTAPDTRSVASARVCNVMPRPPTRYSLTWKTCTEAAWCRARAVAKATASSLPGESSMASRRRVNMAWFRYLCGGYRYGRVSRCGGVSCRGSIVSNRLTRSGPGQTANLLVCGNPIPKDPPKGEGRPPSRMSTCLVVQHVAPESAFALGDALHAAGVHVDTRRVFAGDAVPAGAEAFDGVVVMGGPMSATSDEGFPSRGAELSLLSDAIRSGIPTLGVCLGAQLLAVAAGGSVHAGLDGPEIGWFPVRMASRDDRLFTGLPDTFSVLQWHGETFELPPEGQLVVTGTPYANQAFRIGDVAWGLQFHLEVTAVAVEGFLAAFADDLGGVPGATDGLRASTPAAAAKLAPVRDLVCARFAGLVAARVTRDDLVLE